MFVSKPTLSFLMMAKNVERYIDAAIRPLAAESTVDWELIVVDDHSEDRTLAVASGWADRDRRIRVFPNPGEGKVTGTSFAFTKSRGEHIKCIDSDDVLKAEFFRVFERHASHDVLFHAAQVVDELLVPITDYFPNSAWMNGRYSDVVGGLVSFPKFSWSFSREIAGQVFPLPETLPFEDVWISLMLKRHSKAAKYIPAPLYQYRQHATQTFGGILNFSREAVEFRARRLLKLMEVLEQEERIMQGLDARVFDAARLENRFLLGDAAFGTLLEQKGLGRRVPRLVLMKYAPAVSSRLARARWRYERLRSRSLAGETVQ